MNNKKIENVLNLSAEDRYNYFIRKSVDFEEVWGLKDKDGWALLGSDNKEKLFPIWSEKEFAELCAVDNWDNYVPAVILLSDFLNKLLPKLEKDNILFAVFLTPKNKGIVVAPKKVKMDIENECEQYE